jgi:protein TonB
LYATSARERAVSATASLAIIACGAAALVIGLAPDSPIRRNVEQTLTAFTPDRETPPTKRPAPPPAPTDRKTDKAESSRARDAASPRNLRNRATAIFAPVLPPLRSPPPVIAAAKPALGSASKSGASDVIGPGQGAGGFGNGTGGGGNGDGGDGDGDGDSVTRPIQISGKLRWSDLPRDLRQSHRGGELELVYRVSIDGRVSNCRITRSSGLASLDAQTCRLITERFRFRPSRDAAGRPVPANIIEVHGWDPAPDDVIDDGDD